MKTGIIMGASVEKFESEALRLKRIGYDCMDLQQFLHPDNVFYQMTDDEWLNIRKITEKIGISISQIHGPWVFPPKNDTEEEQSEWLATTRKAVHACAVLNGKHLVIHPVMPKEYFDDSDVEKVLKNNRDFFQKLIPFAEKEKVTVCLENMPFHSSVLAQPKDILQFVKSFNSPCFKVCLDTGHCNVHQIDSGEAVRMIGKEYLATLHVHDNTGDGDHHKNPFDGTIDWKNFAAALSEIEFNGTVSLETSIYGKHHQDLPQKIRDLREAALYQCAVSLANCFQ